VIDLAKRESLLTESPATIETRARRRALSLEREPTSSFDVLVMDGVSGDSIPMHLLTREAMAVYVRHLRPAGVLGVPGHQPLHRHRAGRGEPRAGRRSGCGAGFPTLRTARRGRLLAFGYRSDPRDVKPGRLLETPQIRDVGRYWLSGQTSVSGPDDTTIACGGLEIVRSFPLRFSCHPIGFLQATVIPLGSANAPYPRLLLL